MRSSPLRALARLSARVLLLPALLVALAPAPALARSLAIRGFDVELLVRRDGSLLVTERITVHFEGEWNGLYRTIPVTYDWNGFNYRLRLDLQSATDERGNTLEVDSDRDAGNRRFRIWVPGAHDATHTITLQYVVANGLRFFEDHDELYWNVTGNDWDVPVGDATASIILPTNVANLRAASYTGPHGAAQQGAALEQIANSVQVRTTSPLAFREGLTVVVGWDPGVVHRPTELERAGAFVAANGILVVPVLVFFLMLGWWRRHGRDPDALSIAPQYEPPAGLTPGEIGMLVDNRADMRDVTATLVDLAVRGFIVIEDEEDSALFGLVKTRDYTFRLVRPEPAAWVDLKPHEAALLRTMFDGGARTSVELDELENTFYKDLPAIKTALTESLVDHGFCKSRPDHVLAKYLVLGVIAGAVVGFGGAFLLSRLGASVVPAIIAGVLSDLVMTGFAFIMPALTVRGARMRELALGFSEFLGRVEQDRFDRVIRTPEMFEKFLPYAMAFGLEKKWARAFDDIYREPPDWYRGRHGDRFLAHAFVADLSGMADRTSSAMASSPRGSSGSSGFGGGGFSGGGFGGGGGGGF